jgi:tetratricopeptide (TPR) repeat protein
MAKKLQSKSKTPISSPSSLAATKKEIPPMPQSKDLAGSKSFLSSFYGQALLLFLLSFVFYGNTLWNGYALDDYMVILDNNHTKAGFKGIKPLLTKDSMHGIFGDSPMRPTLTFYRPLSYITFAVEYQLFGLKPWLSHLFNVILFGATAVVIFQFLRRILLPNAPYIALATTILFVIHPAHVEVVANIKGRDELLAFLLVMLAGYCAFYKIREGLVPPLVFQFAAAACFFLSLLAKENTIAFLLIFPLTAWFAGKASWATIARTQAPIWSATLLYLFLRFIIIGFDLENETTNVLNNRYLHASWEQALATKVYILLFYIKLLFWPYPLFWDYGYNAFPFQSFSSYGFLVSLLINGGLLIWAILQLPKRSNLIAYGILFYFIALTLVSNLFINLGGFVAERFLYQASLGFCLALALVFAKLFSSFSLASLRLRYWLMGGLALPILALSAFLTLSRNREWKDNATLFIADMRKGSGSAAINRAGASELITQASQTSDSAQKKRLIAEALHYLYRSRDTLPEHIDANLELFRAYVTLNDWSKALPFYEKARAINSVAPRVIQNAQFIAGKFSWKGNICVNQAAAAPSQQEKIEWVRQARQYYEKALYYFPNWQPAVMGIGNAYFQTMQLDSVEKYYFAAQNINPSDSALKKNLALLYSKRAEIATKNGDSKSALEYMQKAVEAAPFQAVNWENLGFCYVQVREFEKALAAYEKAVLLEPGSAQRWYNLGYGYFAAGKKDKAREAWRKTLQLQPNHPQALQGMASL